VVICKGGRVNSELIVKNKNLTFCEECGFLKIGHFSEKIQQSLKFEHFYGKNVANFCGIGDFVEKCGRLFRRKNMIFEKPPKKIFQFAYNASLTLFS
jgi:hypothetical protein